MAEQLSGWTPKTEHLLLCNGVVGGGYDIIDHAFEASFPLHLLHELRANGWIGDDDSGNCCEAKNKEGRLTPARTALDVNMMQSVLGGFLLDYNRIRGDDSAFISREERSQIDFPMNYPFLQRLIRAIENTVIENDTNTMLRQHFEFDASLTSVQLARYCGDNKSGYPRHCDRGMTCTQERTNADEEEEEEEEMMQRLLTCVYYLTPTDWHEESDGGALRIFCPQKQQQHTSKGYFDVTPHSGRLVVFRSDVLEHEVMPSKRRERIAITVWLYGRRLIVKNDKLVSSQEKRKESETSYRKSDDAIRISNSTILLPPPLPIMAESVTQNHHNDATIFVAIPSYRDIETFPTIKSLIETSSHPQRIFIGVVYQVDTSSDEEIEQFSSSGKGYASYFKSCEWNHQVNLRTITIDYRHATGPCYARHLAQSLHRGEDYVLQIDSHMRFRPRWDDYLIHQLGQCHDPSMSLLTTYPPNFDPPHGPGPHAETRGTILVPWKFDNKDGMLRQKGRLMNLRSRSNSSQDNNNNNNNNNNNIPCLLFAAGFNFFQSKLLELCPYDGKLHGLFFGEEISMAVRLFTNGVDLYAPPETVCYHMWKRNPLRRQEQVARSVKGSIDSNNAANDPSTRGREASLNVVRMQLCGMGRGLGTMRTAKQFQEALGVNFETLALSKGCENAGLDDDAFVSSSQGTAGDDSAFDLNHGGDEKAVILEDDMSMVMSLVSSYL
jgi:[Skp1-protein]-hydroxyproline N-acetylglucosaminyltransferase